MSARREEWEVIDRIAMLGDCMSAISGLLLPEADLDTVNRGHLHTLLDWLSSQHRAALDELEAARAREKVLRA